MSLEGLCEIYYKQDIAQAGSFGYYSKKGQKPKADEVSSIQPTTASAGIVADLRVDFNYSGKQLASDWKNQQCPIPLSPELKVTVEDVLYMINKCTSRKGTLIGVRFTQEVTLSGAVSSKWKLISYKPS